MAVTPDRDTLVSVNDTVHLSATGRDHAGVLMPGAAFTWASSDSAVAMVSAGIVTAKKNGTATITANANGKSAGATIVVRQQAATLEVLAGQTQGATVGFALDTALSFRVRDAGGSLAEGVVLGFTGVNGAGSATPPQATTNAAGEATTSWRLGTAVGVQRLSVVAVENTAVAAIIDATGFADEPDTMFAVGGMNQMELPSLALPANLQVKVIDKHGNPIPDVPIVFSVVTGAGTLDSTDVFTDLDGVATTGWTLGSGLGAQTVRAVLPDSAVGTIVDLPGSPVTFTATGVEFAVTGVAATPVVGQEMIVVGTGFDPVAANNTVTVGGLAATVTGVTDAQTKLHVVVPAFGCTPAQSRSIGVTRGAATRSTSALVHPANALALGVGQHTVVSDPAAYCLQFLANDGGTDEYLVGLTSTRAVNGELQFVMSGAVEALAPGAADGLSAISDKVRLSEALSFTSDKVRLSDLARPGATSPVRRERALRDWESAFFASSKARAAGSALRAATATRLSAVGDMILLRVPDITTDACNNFSTVSARVIAMGPRLTVATNATLPTDPASVAAMTTALDGFVNAFGALIYGVATTHFGVPADLDGDQRVIVLFSPAVTASGLPTFTSAVDHVASSVCAASNNGEVVYAAAPAAPTASELAALLTNRLPDLTHDLAHLIQLSRRIGAGGFPLPSWLAEAQATLASELGGLAIRGDAGGADHGASIVNADARSLQWYKPLFDNLSFLFGWDGATGTIAGAPERCSVFGFGGVSTPCVGTFGRGAAWSFLRFVANRMAATYTTGEAGFMRDLTGNTPKANAVAVLESLAGAPLDELLVQWAMALYVDGRVAAASAPALQMSNWNLADILGARPASQQLTPASFGFTAFSRPGIVVGGGTAYTRVSAAAAHGALALQVRDGSGGNLGTELQPRLWIVRIK